MVGCVYYVYIFFEGPGGFIDQIDKNNIDYLKGLGSGVPQPSFQ